MVQLTEEQKLEKLVGLERRIHSKKNGNRMRHLVNVVAEAYKDNPEDLETYFSNTQVFGKEYTLSGIATSAYYKITGDISVIQKYKGGLGATIISKEEGLRFKYALDFARIKKGALPKSLLISSASNAVFEPHSMVGANFYSCAATEATFQPHSATGSYFGNNSAMRATFQPHSATGANFQMMRKNSIATVTVSHAIFEPNSATGANFDNNIRYFQRNDLPIFEDNSRPYHLQNGFLRNENHRLHILEHTLLPIISNKTSIGISNPLFDTLSVLADIYSENGRLPRETFTLGFTTENEPAQKYDVLSSGVVNLVKDVIARSRHLTEQQINSTQDPIEKAVLTVLHRMYAPEAYRRAS